MNPIQRTFADFLVASDPYKDRSRRAKFFDRLNIVVPWKLLVELIRPHYYKNTRGRPAWDLETMIRVHITQVAYNMSDPEMEDQLRDSIAVREFVGIAQGNRVPDETTILNFRHLLENAGLGQQMMDTINEHVKKAGLMMSKGTLVDATFIEAPGSTKNKDKARDPEMKQGKKGNNWHFGMKMHIGADKETGLVHTATFTPANVHDSNEMVNVLHEDDEETYADSGYLGVNKRESGKAFKKMKWHIAVRYGKRKKLRETNPDAEFEEHRKSSVRSKVEHIFKRIKLEFGYSKCRYRGIEKNKNRLLTLLMLSNLQTLFCYIKRHGGLVTGFLPSQTVPIACKI